MAGVNGTSGAGDEEEGQVRGTREGQKVLLEISPASVLSGARADSTT